MARGDRDLKRHPRLSTPKKGKLKLRMKKLVDKRWNEACDEIEQTAENVKLPVEQNNPFRFVNSKKDLAEAGCSLMSTAYNSVDDDSADNINARKSGNFSISQNLEGADCSIGNDTSYMNENMSAETDKNHESPSLGGMSVYPIVISDSSDDEENPKKRIKLKQADVCTVSDIRISKVTSLAGDTVPSSSDIVIIEDDDETKNGSKMDEDNISINSDVQRYENNVCKTESITNVDYENAETSSSGICNNAVAEKEVCGLNSENNDVVSKNDGPSDTTTNSSVPANGSLDSVRKISLEFNEFLAQCVACDCDKKHLELMKKKIPAIKERYLQAHPEFVTDSKFVNLLTENVERMDKKPANAILYFNNVWEELGILKETDNVDLTDRQAMHIKKLNHSLVRVNKKIKKIEEKPVDWDDENDSSYIQLERYRKRFCDIHRKLCSYTKQNPFAGRPMFRKLDFATSKYEEINRAIDKLYSKTKSFPTHCEVDQCVRKCVRDHNLTISGDLLDLEIKQVFTAMGKLLQKRRKTELRITLDDFVDFTEDPALGDANLNSILDKQYEDGKVKIEAVLQKYTDKQEAGEDPAVSSDSDDSNHGSGSSEYPE